QRLHLGFEVVVVFTRRADTAQLFRNGSAGYGFRVDPERGGNLGRGHQVLEVVHRAGSLSWSGPWMLSRAIWWRTERDESGCRSPVRSGRWASARRSRSRRDTRRASARALPAVPMPRAV